ncbi:pilus (MSHA type) biogenesis protein MshL [Psychromonas sp. psych-6C06]|uniref:pilus (MSHA type) biogenesis protein MshL n=1 Tax=Psychromonas sp. psych-6C06 TaxID=2058089 RepID=UPI000C342FF4|nr:pilus (MSHA type) biogenesis protein MshL [Psychromonas sp. psych-6C06]PKF62961.1 pilus (MSHA type) biogenesis protein MshL [Psychromonas sp. psych-6C06]
MKKIISISCCILLLTACQITKKNDAAAQKEVLQTPDEQLISELILPSEIEDELYADLDEQTQRIAPEERRIDISARDADARIFFASLINDSDYSVAIHPDVTGEITLVLKQVTLAEAIRVIEDMYGYEIKLRGRVYHIYPAGMRIASFTLDYLFMNRMGGSRTTVLAGNLSDDDDDDDDDDDSSSGSSSSNSSNSNSSNRADDAKDNEFSGQFSSNGLQDGTKITTITSTNYWAYLEYKINSLLENKEGRDVIVSPMSGVITIRAYPNEIRSVRDFLEKETDHLTRQVILEMQLIEVVLSDEYQQGVSWTNAGDTIGTTDVLFDSVAKVADNVIKNTIGGGGALTISNGSFSAVVSLLSTQGDVNVLSKPRITAMNNQKAIIKVGGDEYFVTDISTTTVSGIDSVNPSVELTPFFSGISVDVTPKINDDDSVLLHIHPAIIDIEEQTKTISFGADASADLVIPVAKSDVRESDTVVKANSGEVIVIGGLMKTIEKDLVSKVPFIGDIPWLGEFFTNRQKVNNKTELVILVKPQVVKKNTWKQEIQKSSDLIEKWYPSK